MPELDPTLLVFLQLSVTLAACRAVGWARCCTCWPPLPPARGHSHCSLRAPVIVTTLMATPIFDRVYRRNAREQGTLGMAAGR